MVRIRAFLPSSFSPHLLPILSPLSPPTRWHPCWSVAPSRQTKGCHAKGLRRNGAPWPELIHSCPEHPGSPERAADGEAEIPPPRQDSAPMPLCHPPNAAPASLVTQGILLPADTSWCNSGHSHYLFLQLELKPRESGNCVQWHLARSRHLILLVAQMKEVRTAPREGKELCEGPSEASARPGLEHRPASPRPGLFLISSRLCPQGD